MFNLYDGLMKWIIYRANDGVGTDINKDKGCQRQVLMDVVGNFWIAKRCNPLNVV